jgi:hypothetical protein
VNDRRQFNLYHPIKVPSPFDSVLLVLPGLNRSGKSSRLRWVNYLRPGLKKGQLTPLEEGIIIELHALLGNK